MTIVLSVLPLLCRAQEAEDTLLVPVSTEAPAPSSQPRKMSVVRRTVRGFDRLNNAYIEPQHYVFTVMLQATHTYDLFTLSSRGTDNYQSITFAPDMRMKVGPYVGWKWFFAGYTFELDDINFNKIKQQLDLSIYSSQIGIDLFFRRTGNDYKLRNADLGRDINVSRLEGVPFDGIKAGIAGFNVYYIFNHGRFSYPAAFSQSTIQKVSCGSWMAGVGYTRNSLDVDYVRLQQTIDKELGHDVVRLDSGMMIKSVFYHDFNVSGGYAYNWVFAPNWLLAGSVQAQLAYKKSTGDADIDSRKGFQFENINLNAIGRFGLVYNNMRWYAGASVILRSNNYRKPRFSTNNTFGSMNLYLGFNFGLKKKYRKTNDNNL